MVFYIGLAAVFAAGLFLFRSGTSGSEFVAGYITEYSLSVDNLFVFIIIMARFAVPALAVDKVLYIGIVVSMLLRGDLHRRGGRRHRGRELGLLPLRRVPGVHRRAAGARGRERRGRLPGERACCAGSGGSCRSPRDTRARP